MRCCGTVEVVSRERHRASLTVTLGRCLRCERLHCSTQLAPQVPWISAVERRALELRDAMIDRLWP
jgi:hypothetical protein